ncbi:MAG: hypothetical protein HPY58_04225 [Firmicutes bacterium]|nr:hypothetical protein [Bacillota bacterium]
MKGDDITGLKKDMASVRDDIQDLKNAVTKIEVRIENEVSKKFMPSMMPDLSRGRKKTGTNWAPKQANRLRSKTRSP